MLDQTRTADSPTFTEIAHPAPVTVTVHNSLGITVRELASGDYPEGMSTLWWDGLDSNGVRSPNGPYFVRLVTPSGTHTEKLMLMR